LPMECECLTGCGDGVAQWNWGTPKRRPPKIEVICFGGGGGKLQLSFKISSACRWDFSYFQIKYLFDWIVFECPVDGFFCLRIIKRITTTRKGIINFIYSTTNMITRPNSHDTVVRITADNNIDQAKHIFAITGQFNDAIWVLKNLCSVVWCDFRYSRAKLIQYVSLSRSIPSLNLKDSINTIMIAAMILSPIALE
jgi:hypothetical protein